MSDEILNKFSLSVIKNLDKDNVYKITTFLMNEKCNYIDDLISDYLDLFTISYDDFINIYNKLNIKYNNCFLALAKEDMDLFEEFFNE